MINYTLNKLLEKSMKNNFDLITGVAGFIGFSLALKLLKKIN